jgi:hypothetical protein
MRKAMYGMIILVLLGYPACGNAARWLFCARCLPNAGLRADWVIDAIDFPGTFSEAVRFPDPDQCGVGADTPETFWMGAYSSWGIELVRAGHWVETITRYGRITYGDCDHDQDLSFYDVLVIPEPQMVYSQDEIDAIINFVFDGGALFLIGNHCGSDRNGSGADSSVVFKLMDTAGHFGIEFETYDGCLDPEPPPECAACSWTELRNTNFVPDADDPFIHGPYGEVEAIKFNAATSIIMHPENNQTVRGHAWRNDAAGQGLADVTVASAYFGEGRVAAIGDSAPADDGTGDPDCNLHNSWDYPTSNNDILFMNISDWLSSRETTPLPTRTPCPNHTPWPFCDGTATPGAPTFTPGPTHTPYDVPLIDIYTNQLVYRSGDTFILYEDMSNAGPGRIVNYFLALEVAGMFFFSPDWTQDIAWTRMYIHSGYDQSREVFQFIWPDAGHIPGIRFWALFTDPDTGGMIGDYDMTEFSAV